MKMANVFYSLYFYFTPCTLQLICVLFHNQLVAFVYSGESNSDPQAMPSYPDISDL